MSPLVRPIWVWFYGYIQCILLVFINFITFLSLKRPFDQSSQRRGTLHNCAQWWWRWCWHAQPSKAHCCVIHNSSHPPPPSSNWKLTVGRVLIFNLFSRRVSRLISFLLEGCLWRNQLFNMVTFPPGSLEFARFMNACVGNACSISCHFSLPGPFVMNTQEQINQTINDYRNAKNGFEKAAHWKSYVYK